MSLPSLNNLDKSTWQKLPFGEIAQSIGERVDPTTTDLEIYVGLGHIDPESLHIKRFGKREDVSGTKLRCYPGDVIFGRRRAYQRKAAICEFDGFCSAHSLVLRASPEVIDPKLFPFFLHSDQFMHRAVDISVGGLSPTINWTKLKKEGFLIPPKDQQAKLAKLLWAADALMESHSAVTANLRTHMLSFSKELFSGRVRLNGNSSKLAESPLGPIPANWEVRKVEDVSKVIRGSSPRPKGDPKYYGGPIPRLMGEDVTRDGKLVTPRIDSLTVEGAKLSRPMPAGTLVMICSGNVGLSSILAVDCCIHDGFIAFPEIAEECNRDFLYYTFNSQLFRLFQNATHGGVFTNLTTSIIKNFEIVIPPREEQDFICSEVIEFERRVESAKDGENGVKQLLKSLINQIF